MKLLTAVFGVIILALAGVSYYLFDNGNNVKQELEAIKTGYLEADKNAEILKKENAELSTELDSMRRKNAKLYEQLDQVAENSEQSSGQLEELQNRIQEMELQISQLEQDKKTIAAKLESKAAELVLKEEELAERKAAPAVVTAPVEEKKPEVNRFRSIQQQLSREMAIEVGGKLASISPSTKTLSITLVEKSLFDFGRAVITEKGENLLDKIGKILKNSKGTNIHIEGFHDNKDLGFFIRANYATPWELTSARATAVARYLSEKAGVSGKNLSAAGRSKHHPIASNKTDKGRSQNRRIVITLSHDG